MRVADYIAQFLVDRQIRHVFGFQGSAILRMLHSMLETGRIRYIQNYHEQAASFCADSYARISGRTGVAIATSGPGAVNLIGGIVNSYYDSIPCMFFTGQDYVSNIMKGENVRTNGFQDMDIVSMVKPVTKYARTITDETLIRYELEKAYFLAHSGRPGSVLLDIPIDIQFKEIQPDRLTGFYPQDIDYPCSEIPQVMDLIKKAEKPLILAGGGIRASGSYDVFRKFFVSSGISVVTTLNGIDSCSSSIGFAGLHGNTAANLAVLNADLLLVLGSRLGQRQVGKEKSKYTKAKIIHVDIDHSEFNRSVDEDFSIFCDLRIFLNEMLTTAVRTDFPEYRDWKTQIKHWETEYEDNVCVNSSIMDPVRVVRKLWKLFDDNAIVTCDIGQNQMWAAQGNRITENQRMIHASGYGPMGYSLPAAVGARIAAPHRQVIGMMGDGGLQMNLQELLLIGQNQINIKVLVFNNNTLGLIRETQERYFNSEFPGTNPDDFVCCNLAGAAETFNLDYAEISSLDDVPAVSSVLNSSRPALVDIKIDMDARCLNRYDDFQALGIYD